MFYFVFKLKFSVGSFFGSSFWFIFWYQILAPKIEPRDHLLVPNFGTKNQTAGSLFGTKFWHQKSIREVTFWYQFLVHIFALRVLEKCVFLRTCGLHFVAAGGRKCRAVEHVAMGRVAMGSMCAWACLGA